MCIYVFWSCGKKGKIKKKGLLIKTGRFYEKIVLKSRKILKFFFETFRYESTSTSFTRFLSWLSTCKKGKGEEDTKKMKTGESSVSEKILRYTQQKKEEQSVQKP